MITELNLTSTECMGEDRFWELVGLAHWPCDHEKMRMKYRKMLSKEEVKSFRLTLNKAYSELDVIVSKIINEDDNYYLSDDGFSDFVYHVIGLGRKKFFEYCNNPDLIKKMIKDNGYKESFAYCIPYISDYCEDSEYTLSHVIKVAKMCVNEVKFFEKMDYDARGKMWNHLKEIGEDLFTVKVIASCFVDVKSLEDLVIDKGAMFKSAETIEKFFEKNYMELPRKFTSARKDGSNFNGACTALFKNLMYDAEKVIEFNKS